MIGILLFGLKAEAALCSDSSSTTGFFFLIVIKYLIVFKITKTNILVLEELLSTMTA